MGNRRILLGCWGAFQDPEVVDYRYENMTDWGRAMFVTPGIVVDGKLITTDLVEINLGIRILLGNSFYDDWHSEETFVKQGSAGQPGRPAPPLEPDHHPQAAEAQPARGPLQLGDEPALARQAHRAITWRSTPAAGRWPGCGSPPWPSWSTRPT